MKLRFLLLLLPGIFYGQAEQLNLPEIIPPSPTVASLMQFEEVPVNNYTGQPDISIPIYSKQLNSDLNLSLSLNYSTSGIKVTQRSGWTGTGWSLVGGGTISRTVRGLPDEALMDGQNIFTGIYHLDIFWDYENADDLEKNRYLWKVNGTDSEKYDSQYDLYQFNIIGATGRFIIKKEGNTLKPLLLTKGTNVKIDLNWDSQTFKVLSFKVIDSKGYKYYFESAGVEVTDNKIWTASFPQGIPENGVPPPTLHSNMSNTVNTAWQLTKITTPYNEELVNFIYNTVQEKYNTYTNITEYNLLSSFIEQSYLNASSPTSKAYNQSVLKPKKEYSYNHCVVQTKKLSQIIFRDDTSLRFNTSGYHPELEPNTGTTLSNIQFKNSSGSVYKTTTFSYQTITSPSGNKKRLWLTGVSETAPGTVGAAKYVLSYYENDQLPGFDEGNNDGWGYNTSESDPDVVRYGVLNRIQYPTGGVKDFEFESHTFSYEGDNLIAKSETDNNPDNADNPTGNTYHQFLYGGGVRIKEILFRENSSATDFEKRIGYFYNEPVSSGEFPGPIIHDPNDPFEPSLKSSGSVMAKAGSMTKDYVLPDKVFLMTQNGVCDSYPDDVIYHVKSNEPVAELTNDSYVGYQFVRVRQYDTEYSYSAVGGYTAYTYRSPKDEPAPVDVYTYPFHPSPNLDYKRGMLLKKQVFNSDNEEVERVENIYTFSSEEIATSYLLTTSACPWRMYYLTYESYAAKYPSAGDFGCGHAVYETCGGTGGDDENPIAVVPYSFGKEKLEAGLAQLERTIHTVIDEDGREMVTETHYSYNNLNYELALKTVTIKEGGGDTVYRTEYDYIDSNGTYTSAEQVVVNDMLSRNMVTAIREVRAYKSPYLQSTTLLQQAKYEYSNTNGKIQLASISTFKQGSNKREVVSYGPVNEIGNYRSVKNRKGVEEIYIWGYNNTLPIAKIEGESLTQVISQLGLSMAQFYALNENSSIISSLRTMLPNSMVTTFTYDPAYGITSVTDPKGYTTYFIYDGFGRLDYVKDYNNKILKDYEYHYRPIF